MKPYENRSYQYKHVYQFKVTLNDIEPAIWRRIRVPSRYSFWDLHVAIQDAMGWQDYHLHQFEMKRTHAHSVTYIGIPDEEFNDIEIRPGWEAELSFFFTHLGTSALYRYDFGDNWQHALLLEGELIAEPGVKYPICLSGSGKCPPEDCGGTSGYFDFLEAIVNPLHPEHARMLEWYGGPYDVNEFDPQQVSFDSPRKRWKLAFQQSG